MLLYRIAPEGFYAAREPGSSELRVLHSDPFETPVAAWELGTSIPLGSVVPMTPLAPILPGKIVGIGRNYRDHVKELNNPMPAEPVIFLKAISSVIGPGAAIVLPPESQRVEHEGEIAVVLRHRLKRADPEQARAAVLGITCACDVTARDLQRTDPCFSRAKSFDTFCPLGPAIAIAPELVDLENLEVVTRVNGEERQRGHTRDLTWGIVELIVYASRMMTLERGDVLLTGSPAGVGALKDGDKVEVEIAQVGVLANPVKAFQL